MANCKCCHLFLLFASVATWFLLQKEKARSEAKLMTEYRDLVKKGREQFKRELESIMPEVPFKKRIGEFSSDPIDFRLEMALLREVATPIGTEILL